jgi:IS30 family transposase
VASTDYEVRDGVAVWTRTEIVDAERARVVAAVKDGMSIRETAEALGIHRSKVERLRKSAKETGELSSAPARAAGSPLFTLHSRGFCSLPRSTDP